MAHLRIAVLLEGVQLSDIACIDLLGNCSTQYNDQLLTADPQFEVLRPHTVDMEFLFLSTDTEKPTWVTPGMQIKTTHTYDTAPRDIDILLVGGPLVHTIPDASLPYIREVCADPKPKTIMSTCLGSVWLAKAGVLDGIKATTNRVYMKSAREMAPGVEWQDQRWSIDLRDHLKYWTSGGAGAGTDMLGQYIKQHFHKDLVDAALDSLDVDPDARGQFYPSSSSSSSSSQLKA